MTKKNPAVPSVFFNHLYIVLDDKTYRAIQASDFLRSAFSGMERRATRTAIGETWVGTYYYGLDNYLEFFGESTGQHWKPSARAGWSGLAFSIDTAGGAEAVRQQIQKEFGYEPHFHLRQIVTADQTVNWFYNVRLAETLDVNSFDSWVMEYHPDIFAQKRIPAEDGPTRQTYLSPWNRATSVEKQGKTSITTPVFTRVIGATLHLPETAARQYARILGALGYQTQEANDQLTLAAHGFTLTLRLQSSGGENASKLSAIRLEMARPSVSPVTFVFAPGSRLVLHENLTADWFFD